ncbi:hypothetical protein V5E97_31805 [Singulisphaera sp. Ch08]|uniref:Uncharacterized protein n=1 Tax=Singulisphaera sp. Ch08 TaxID=3120278 RepID=A0AAU7CCR4_9BACT
MFLPQLARMAHGLLKSRQHRRLTRRTARLRESTLIRLEAAVERLERRELLTGPTIDVAVAAGLLSDHAIRSITTVTQGIQALDDGGDGMLDLAQAIHGRLDQDNGTGATAWLVRYDVNQEGGQGVIDLDDSILPAASAAGLSGDLVVLFNWAPESQEVSSGWAEAAGDALFNLIARLDPVLVQPVPSPAPKLHLIGHGSGAAVTSEAVERLAGLKISVDQVTYLDPHDFVQDGLPFDEPQRQSVLGQPAGYGASAWQSVAFTDVYYQTRGQNGVPGTADDVLVPRGRPIPGAHNVFLNGVLPSPGGYLPIDLIGDHRWVWSDFYKDTVTFSTATTGFAFASNPGSRPTTPRFFSNPIDGEPQDHRYSDPRYVDQGTGLPSAKLSTEFGLTPSGFAAKQWTPEWVPAMIVNGDFAAAGDEFITDGPIPAPLGNYYLVEPNNIVPGWSHHGGGGGAHIRSEGGALFPNYFLELKASADPQESWRTHNNLFVPRQSGTLHLVFDMQVTRPSASDRLEVVLGGEVLAQVELSRVDQGWHTKWLSVPAALQGLSPSLTFRLADASGPIESTVRVDNVRFESFDRDELRQKIETAKLTSAIKGVTVITHGFQAFGSAAEGDGLRGIADAVLASAGMVGRKGWLLDYDLPYEGGIGYFDTHQSIIDTGAGDIELVLLYDWSAESNEASPGWTEAAGDALFNLLIDTGLIDPRQGKLGDPLDDANPIELHFIGHSLGAAVTSEAVERLAHYGIGVDQVTYLDPHDFYQLPMPDILQGQATLGAPVAYGASVWNNVAFADVYYQTRGENGSSVPDLVVPLGRPIPGAYNVHLAAELPDDFAGSPYASNDPSGDHSWIWNQFYRSTVPGTLPPSVPSGDPALLAIHRGYRLSRLGAIAAGLNLETVRAAHASNFYGTDVAGKPQDHTYSSPLLVNPAFAGNPNVAGLAYLGLTPEEVTFAGGLDDKHRGWGPVWDPFQVVNGGFDAPGDEHNPDLQGITPAILLGQLPPLLERNIIPGWSHHSGRTDRGESAGAGTNPAAVGSGQAHVAALAGDLLGDYFLRLKGATDPAEAVRTHNAVYVDPDARFLTFELRRFAPGAGNRLEVLLGDTVLRTVVSADMAQLALDGADGFSRTIRVQIPQADAAGKSLRGRSLPITFRIVSDGGAPLQSEAWVDDVRFEGLNVATVHELLKAVWVTGVTVVTHGFQALGSAADGDGMMPLARAIASRANALPDRDAWLLDVDIPGEGKLAAFDPHPLESGLFEVPLAPGGQVELVVLFDWSPESNEFSGGWTEAAGDALFNMLVGMGVVNPATGETPPLHFIAHSFGAAVTSEAIERLAAYKVPVDQVTYLDPHDFDQGLLFDAKQSQNVVGRPSGYGAAIWSNVAFADVYYQTRGANSLPSLLRDALPGQMVPDGRPIPGAYNVFLDEDDLPEEDAFGVAYASGNFSGDHTFVWSDFYASTITNAALSTGFAFSRIARATNPVVTLPARQFYGPGQDHQYTPSAILAETDPARRFEITQGRWAFQWNSLEIVNGDFQDAGDEHSGIPLLDLNDLDALIATLPAAQRQQALAYRNDLVQAQASFGEHNIVPGWSHHGGGGGAHVIKDQATPGQFALELRGPAQSPLGALLGALADELTLGAAGALVGNRSEAVRGHNSLFVPATAGFLRFDLRTFETSTDLFLVRLGGEVLGTPVDLRQAANGAKQSTLVLAIPDRLRGQTQELSFELVPLNPLGIVAGRVWIDNVSFTPAYAGRTGDVIGVDLRKQAPGSSFVLTTVGGQAVPAGATRIDLPQGTILLPEHFGGQLFATSGVLYFLPNPDGLNIGDGNVWPGFQGILNGTILVDGQVRPLEIAVLDGYSPTGANQVTVGAGALDIYRVQQRLRYLGFPGYSAPSFDFSGRTGDVIPVNLALGGGSHFELVSVNGQPVSGQAVSSLLGAGGVSLGQVVLSDRMTGVPFAQSGRLYLIPNPDAAENLDSDPQRGFQGTISGQVRIDGILVDFSIAVDGGASPLADPGTVNTTREMYEVQQRLRYLGIPGFAGDSTTPESRTAAVALPVVGDQGGALPAETAWAIGLFNAIVADAAAPMPVVAAANTFVGLAYLNAPAGSPLWTAIDTNVQGLFLLPGLEGGDNPEGSATIWAQEVLQAASANWVARRALKLDWSGTNLALRSASLNRGGGYPPYHTNELLGSHQTGLDLDFETAATNDLTVPFYRTHTVGGVRYIAARTSGDTAGDSHVVARLADGSYVALPLSGPLSTAVVHDESVYYNADVLNQIKIYLVDNVDADYSLEMVRAQIESFLSPDKSTGLVTASGAAVRVIYIDDPRLWSDGGFAGMVRFSGAQYATPVHDLNAIGAKGLGGVFHIDVARPAAGAALAPPPTALGGSGVGPLAINGQLDAPTQWAMGLFNAAFASPAVVHDPHATTVDVYQINAVNAPHWVPLPTTGAGLDASGLGAGQGYGTSWLAEVLAAGLIQWTAGSATNPPLLLVRASTQTGGAGSADDSDPRYDAGRDLTFKDATDPTKNAAEQALFPALVVPYVVTVTDTPGEFVVHVAPPAPVIALGASAIAGMADVLDGLALTLGALGGPADTGPIAGDSVFMAGFGSQPASINALGQPLPVIGQSTAQSFGLANLLQQGLVLPVAHYLATAGTPTSAGLTAVLAALGGSLGNATFTVAPGSVSGGLVGAGDEAKLEYHVTLQTTLHQSLTLDLAAAGAALGLLFEGPPPLVDVTQSFVLDLTFGYDLSPGLAADEAAYVRFSSPEAISLTTDVPAQALAFGLQVGFLGNIQAQLAGLTMHSAAEVQLVNPDNDLEGTLTLAELKATRLGVAGAIELVNSAGGTLTALASLGTFHTTGHLALGVDPATGRLSLTTDANFSELLNFNHVSAATMVEALDGVGTALGQYASLLTTPVPFTSQSLGEMLDLDGAWASSVGGQLRDAAGAPAFRTAQGLEALLKQRVHPDIVADYDPVTDRLTYRLIATPALAPVTSTVALAQNLAPLAEVNAQGQVTLTPTVSITGGLGLDLTTEDTAPTLDGLRVSGTVMVKAPDIDALARFGFVGIAVVDGHGGLGGDWALQAQFTSGPVNVELGATDPFAGTTLTPEFSGQALLVLPIVVTPAAGGAAPGAAPRIEVVWSDLSDPATLEVRPHDLGNLTDLDGLSFQSVLSALRAAVTYLQDLQQFSFLKQKLPLVNQSISDLLDTADALAQKFDALAQNPAGALQELELAIEEAMGLVPDSPLVSVTLDGKALKIDIKLEQILSQSNEFSLELTELVAALPAGHPARALLAGIAGLVSSQASGRLDVDARSTLDLHLGVDLDRAGSRYLQPFVYDTTAWGLSLKVQGTGLNFTASVGPLGVAVVGGSAVLDADGAGPSVDPARFDLTLTDNDGDHRLYLASLPSLGTIAQVAFVGGMHANLPLYFPTVSNPLGGSAVDGSDPDAIPDNQLDVRIGDLTQVGATTQIVTPDIAGAASTVFLPDPAALSAGLDGLLGGAWDLFKANVLDTPLPLVGRELAQTVTFLQDIRTRVVSAFAGSGALAAKAARQSLFDGLGPNGIGLLADLNGDGQITLEDVRIQADSGSFDAELKLTRPQTLLSNGLSPQLGVPALGFGVGGAVNVLEQFSVNLHFGQDSQGFYVASGDFLAGVLDVSAALTASLGGGIANVTGQANLVLDPTITLTTARPDGRLRLAELTAALSDPASLRLAGRSDLALQFDLSLLPSLPIQFNGQWHWSITSTGTTLIQENSGLDPDSLLNSLAVAVDAGMAKLQGASNSLAALVQSVPFTGAGLAGRLRSLSDDGLSFDRGTQTAHQYLASRGFQVISVVTPQQLVDALSAGTALPQDLLQLHFTRTASQADPALEVGGTKTLGGLGFQLGGRLDTTTALAFDLNFGVDRSGGIYVVEGSRIAASLDLAGSLTGHLDLGGALDVSLAGSGLFDADATLFLDDKDSTAQERIYLTSLGDLSSALRTTLAGRVDVSNLTVTTTVPLLGDFKPSLSFSGNADYDLATGQGTYQFDDQSLRDSLVRQVGKGVQKLGESAQDLARGLRNVPLIGESVADKLVGPIASSLAFNPGQTPLATYLMQRGITVKASITTADLINGNYLNKELLEIRFEPAAATINLAQFTAPQKTLAFDAAGVKTGLTLGGSLSITPRLDLAVTFGLDAQGGLYVREGASAGAADASFLKASVPITARLTGTAFVGKLIDLKATADAKFNGVGLNVVLDNFNGVSREKLYLFDSAASDGGHSIDDAFLSGANNTQVGTVDLNLSLNVDNPAKTMGGVVGSLVGAAMQAFTFQANAHYDIPNGTGSFAVTQYPSFDYLKDKFLQQFVGDLERYNPIPKDLREVLTQPISLLGNKSLVELLGMGSAKILLDPSGITTASQAPNQHGVKVNFDILQPQNIVSMLTGQPADLVSLDIDYTFGGALDPIKLFEAPLFSFFGVLNVTGELSIIPALRLIVDMTAGLDTTGFYIREAPNILRAEGELTAQLTLHGKLLILDLVQVRGRAGLVPYGEIGLDVPGQDGKARAKDLLKTGNYVTTIGLDLKLGVGAEIGLIDLGLSASVDKDFFFHLYSTSTGRRTLGATRSRRSRANCSRRRTRWSISLPILLSSSRTRRAGPPTGSATATARPSRRPES